MGEQADEMKQDCVDALHELWTYIDGELTEEKRTHLSAHLDDCPPCEEARRFHAELRVVVQQRCRDEVPEALRSRIADVIAGLDRPDPR